MMRRLQDARTTGISQVSSCVAHLSLVLLAAGCSRQTPSVPQPSERAPVPPPVSVDLRAAAHDAAPPPREKTAPPAGSTPAKVFWTPEHAMAMALAEPLEFVGRFDGKDLGLHAKICLWRNTHVMLRVDYCSGVAALGIANAPAAWVTGTKIYSPRGEEVALYAEVRSPASVYSAPRSAYIMFNVEYRDRTAAGGFHLDLDLDGYSTFVQTAGALRFGTYPVCFEDFEWITEQRGNITSRSTRGIGRIRCDNSPRDLREVWTREGTKYLQDPPSLWFTYLATIETLVNEGQHRPAR